MFKHLFNQSGFRKYLNSSFWLLFERVINLLVGLFVGIWGARILGSISSLF